MDNVIAGGRRGWGEVEVGKRGINGDGRRLDLGWSVHDAVCG